MAIKDTRLKRQYFKLKTNTKCSVFRWIRIKVVPYSDVYFSLTVHYCNTRSHRVKSLLKAIMESAFWSIFDFHFKQSYFSKKLKWNKVVFYFGVIKVKIYAISPFHKVYWICPINGNRRDSQSLAYSQSLSKELVNPIG